MSEAIGYQIIQTWCRECAPEGVRDYHRPMTEGDGPLWCDVCDKELKPCEHEWDEWRPFCWGGEFRVCVKQDYCEATEYRDLDGNPTERPPMPPLPARTTP